MSAFGEIVNQRGAKEVIDCDIMANMSESRVWRSEWIEIREQKLES